MEDSICHFSYYNPEYNGHKQHAYLCHITIQTIISQKSSHEFTRLATQPRYTYLFFRCRLNQLKYHSVGPICLLVLRTCRNIRQQITSKTIKADDNDLGYLNYHHQFKQSSSVGAQNERAQNQKLKSFGSTQPNYYSTTTTTEYTVVHGMHESIKNQLLL